jgi:hypothetical protein
VKLRIAPPPPTRNYVDRDTIRHAVIRDDNELMVFENNESPKEEYDFLKIHQLLGESWEEIIRLRIEEKRKTLEKPLIIF